jgi:ketosteroid isomerase-like protein
MLKPPFSLMAVVCFGFVGCSTPAPQPFDADGIEEVIRGFTVALQSAQLDSARSFLASDARWIEAGHPIPAADAIDMFENFFSLGWGLEYELHDFSVHGEGDFGWVTWANEGSFTVSTPEGKDLWRSYLDAGWPGTVDSSSVEWRAAALFIESAVLQRQDGAWRIVLGHTTQLPPEQ